MLFVIEDPSLGGLGQVINLLEVLRGIVLDLYLSIRIYVQGLNVTLKEGINQLVLNKHDVLIENKTVRSPFFIELLIKIVFEGVVKGGCHLENGLAMGRIIVWDNNKEFQSR